jgi:hypothetical protein
MLFRSCGCSQLHECWCAVLRRGGRCRRCRACWQNDRDLRTSGVAGTRPCGISLIEVDVIDCGGVHVEFPTR